MTKTSSPTISAMTTDAYRRLGEQLAILHDATVPEITNPYLRVPNATPAEHYFDDALLHGVLHADGIAWLRNLCERLDTVIAAAGRVPQVFVHDDVKPDNVMVDRLGIVHLIDWGDAGYGDPVYDFQSLPLQAAHTALSTYRGERPADPSLEARLVRRVVARSLSNLCRTPLLGPSWYRPIAATLTDLLTFAAQRPDTWHAWTELH